MKFEGTQVNIPIMGITRAGTDNTAAIGAMNEVIGMEFKDGSWLPYEANASQEVNNIAGYTIVKAYAHKLSDSTQITLYLNSARTLYYPNASHNLVQIVTLVRDVAFVGNMVCVATDRGLEYFICESGVYYPYQTGYFPHVDLRVTSGLYEKTDFEVPENSDTIGLRHVSGILGEKIAMSDEDSTIIADNTRYSKIAGGLTAVRGEVRDRGGLTGYVVACVAYRGKNGQIIATGAPVLLSRPHSVLEGKHLNLGTSNGKFYTYDYNRTSQQYESRECTETELNKHPVYQEPLLSEMDWDRDKNDVTREGVTRLYKRNYSSANSSPGQTWTADDREGTQIGIEEITGSTRPYSPSDYDDATHVEDRRLYLMAISKDKETSRVNKPIAPEYFCTEEETYHRYGTLETGNVKRDYTFYSYSVANALQYRIPQIDIQKRRELYSVCIFMSQEIDPFVYEDKIDDVMGMVSTSDKELIHVAESGSVTSYRLDETYATTYLAKLRSTENIIDDIKKIRSLYLVKEVVLEDIEDLNEWVSVDLKGVLGDALVTRESLPITAFDRSKYFPNNLDTYNLRLHMFDYTTELFKGFDITDFAHHGGELQYPTNVMDDEHCTYKWEIKVEINDGNGETHVVNYDAVGSASIINYLSPLIVYPSKYADSITIRIYSYDDRDTPSSINPLSRSYEAKFNLLHNEGLGISYYVDPDLKPIIPSVMKIEPIY